MINWNNPTQTSVVALVLSFILFAAALYVLKPKCIMRDDKDGNSKVSYPILFSASAAFALAVAIIVLLGVSSHSEKNTQTVKVMKNYFY